MSFFILSLYVQSTYIYILDFPFNHKLEVSVLIILRNGQYLSNGHVKHM